MEKLQEYLDVRGLEALLGIAKSTLDKLRLNGDGPNYVRVGRRILYRRSDVDKWLAARVQKSTAENGRSGGRAA